MAQFQRFTGQSKTHYSMNTTCLLYTEGCFANVCHQELDVLFLRLPLPLIPHVSMDQEWAKHQE